MPELPEVETLRRSLELRVRGRVVTRATLHRRDVLILPSDPPGGFSRSGANRPRHARVSPSHLLVGGAIAELCRRGKQMALILNDGRTLVIHLGMTGQVRHLRPRVSIEPINHVHASWLLDDGSRLLFRDPRRFGGLRYLPDASALNAHWATLGPDALTIAGETLAARAASSRRAIKAVLLDQEILAGVGNIYADESLFRAGIAPRRRADRLTPTQFGLLANAIRTTLSLALAARGSTLRDYRDADGEPGSAQDGHLVYGRAGLPCPTCGSPLKALRLAQRTTVWCPRCQR